VVNLCNDKKYTEEHPDGCLREQIMGCEDCDYNKNERNEICQNQ